MINNVTSDEDDIYSINKTDIEELAIEYRNIATQKLSIQEVVRSMSKQLLDKLEEIQLPKIKHILIKFGIIENENLRCPFCNNYEGKNKASLSAHARNCKSNLKNKKDDEDIIIENVIIETVVIETEGGTSVKKHSKIKK